MTILFCVIGNCDAISYYIKTRPEDAQTAEMELIAPQYRGRARVLQAKLFVLFITYLLNGHVFRRWFFLQYDCLRLQIPHLDDAGWLLPESFVHST